MSTVRLCALARLLMQQPAAPYHEDAPRAAAERICDEHGLAHERDRFSNLLVTLNTAPRRRPFVLAAHLDHPGFEIVGELAPGRWRARFLGGVPDRYFQPGVPLRLMPGATPAVLGKRLSNTDELEFEVETTAAPQRSGKHRSAGSPARARQLASHEPADKAVRAAITGPPAFAVWELPDFALRRGRIHGRACDDLIGCAAILAAMIDLKERGAKVHVIGVLARAEEVGFHGALALAASKRLPADSLIVSLETSREMPPVKMGHGVIVRVGDRASVFDSDATRFLCEAGAQLQVREPDFQFQRALMSGGTCEATAYQEFGYQSAGVCVALGNYHNCGAANKIATEFVSVADALGMARVLTEATVQMGNYQKLVGKLPARLNTYLRAARKRLKQ